MPDRPRYTNDYLDRIAVAPPIGVEGLEGTDRTTPPETRAVDRAAANIAKEAGRIAAARAGEQ